MGAHGIATGRTLEQKISDAGPLNQRMEPHIVTIALGNLVAAGEVLVYKKNPGWYCLAGTPGNVVEERYREQAVVHRQLSRGGVPQRLGQCLEIAVYRALAAQDREYFGRFGDLDLTSEERKKARYRKEEPPPYIGNLVIGGERRLDFMMRHEEAGWAGIEVKNVRAWLYIDRDEIKDLLSKAVALDCVPVLIARRYPYVTFKVLTTCGVVVHQSYNQLFHVADRDLAEQAKERRLLGYHDVRVGDAPDGRLRKFIGTNLPDVLPGARERFERFKSLLGEFGDEVIGYEEFAAKVRRREAGEDEEGDWDEY